MNSFAFDYDAIVLDVMLPKLDGWEVFNHDGGEVRIATLREGSTATLTVWNTGPGIPAEDLPHIFDRFHRVDKSRSSGASHSGLGLAITKAIVQAHGGRITARSEPDVETTFTVNLSP